jgi:tripartite-type tricarboxylate transporter receptor subunit TctC
VRLLALLCLLCASALAAAQSYPTKPVRLVNPFAPGGTGEIIFRMIAPAIEERMGQRIVIESRAGAGGNIGAEIVANAPPDGYTLLLGTTNIFTINQFIFSKMTFDPLKVFAPVTLVADVPSVFYVSNAVPASTLREFVAWAKANPGKVNYASPGNGTTPHLNVELLAQIAELKLVHVPYKGLQPSMAAVVANEVQLYLGGLGAGHGLLRAGKMKAVAVGSKARLPAAPDIPTLAESGFRDFVASNWFALAAPAGTPAPILERWSTEVRRALQSPETHKKINDLGIVVVGSTPEELGRQWTEEAKLWERVIRAAKIKAE